MPSSTVTKAASASVAALLLLGLAGCADDDGGDDVEAYCDYSASLDQAEQPTEAQFDEIASLAPDEINDQVELVVEDLNGVDPDAEDLPEFSDEFFTALDEIEAFEAENCDGDTADTDVTADDLTDVTGDTADDLTGATEETIEATGESIVGTVTTEE